MASLFGVVQKKVGYFVTQVEMMVGIVDRWNVLKNMGKL